MPPGAGDRAAGGAARRRHPARHGARQSADRDRGRHLARPHVHVHRRREARIEQRAFRRIADLHRPRQAIIHRQARDEHHLDQALDEILRHAGPQIDRPARLRVAVQNKMQRVAFDFERCRDAIRLVEVDAVVVEIIALRAVKPIRHFLDFLAQGRLANIHPALPAAQHFLGAVFGEQLGETRQAIGVGVHLRGDIAPCHFGRAGVGADHPLDVGEQLATPQDAQRRDQQAFLKQIGGVARIGARHLAPEIGLVRGVADIADNFVVDEHRRDDGDVGRMVLARLVRMIDDEGVPRRGVRKATTDFGDLGGKRSDMQRLRNALRHHARFRIEDREGEILAFLDDGRIARAQHIERQLARDLQGRLVDDFEIDSVHCLIGWVFAICSK